MPQYRAHWLFSLGTLGLLLFLLTACGGGSTSSTGTSSPTPLKSSSSPSASPSSTSTVTLTTSGGLTGTYAVSDQATESNYNTSSSGTELQLAVNDTSWEFSLSFGAYTGPGSYAVDIHHGQVRFYSHDHMKGWELGASALCSVKITNDKPLTLQGSAATEVKGTISCPQLNSGGPTKEQPIAISNGQFDVFSLKSSVG